MQSLSRRKVAAYVASQLQTGNKDVALQQAASYLVAHKKTKQADLLVADIENALAREYGKVKATITTAHGLSDALRTAIQKFVANSQEAKTVELVEQIDESILGGVIIRTPNAEFDASIRSQLNQLKA